MINFSFSFHELEYFLLIMTRVTSFIFIVPFFSMNNTPNRIKIGLGFFISFLLYNTLTPHTPVVYNTLLQYTTLVLKEAATGLLIGFGAQICATIVSFAGRMIDMDIGLSMASQMDPTTREDTTMTGLLFQYSIMMMMIVTGLYRYFLKALVDTFTLIPIGQAVFNNSKLLAAMTAFLSDYIIIGFRICLPVFATIT
ncbi:MAG: flagellar biosynthetic protein FliR, partial [Lachnospiraceae bacterium]